MIERLRKKKVFLRDCKRHTDRSVVSALVSSWEWEGGTPEQDLEIPSFPSCIQWGGGLPLDRDLGVPSSSPSLLARGLIRDTPPPPGRGLIRGYPFPSPLPSPQKGPETRRYLLPSLVDRQNENITFPSYYLRGL